MFRRYLKAFGTFSIGLTVGGGIYYLSKRNFFGENDGKSVKSTLSTSLYKKGLFHFPREYVSELFLSKVKNFPVREDDVWIVTFPKSGTTWISQIVWLLLHNGLEDDKDISRRVLFLEWPDPSLKEIDKWPERRIIKTHIPLELLPESLLDGSSGAKIVYVARNPSHVCLSYYEFIKSLTFLDYKGSLEDFSNDFVKGQLPYAPWSLHVEDGIKRAKQDHILFLKYTDLGEQSTLKDICQFLNVKPTEELIKTTQFKSNFKRMSKNRNVNFEWLKDNGLMVENSKFMNDRKKDEKIGEISKIIENNLDINIISIFVK